MKRKAVSARSLWRAPQGPSAGFVRRAARAARRAGWRVSLTGKNHIELADPVGGRPVRLPLTSSSQRTERRLRAVLRRGGLEVR